MTNETEPTVDEIMSSIRQMMAEGEAVATDEDVSAEQLEDARRQAALKIAEDAKKEQEEATAKAKEIADQQAQDAAAKTQEEARLKKEEAVKKAQEQVRLEEEAKMAVVAEQPITQDAENVDVENTDTTTANEPVTDAADLIVTPAAASPKTPESASAEQADDAVIDLTEDMIVERPAEEENTPTDAFSETAVVIQDEPDLLPEEDALHEPESAAVSHVTTISSTEDEMMPQNRTQPVFEQDNAESLLSAPAVEAAAASLSHLTQLFAAQEQAPVGNGDLTLETLTKELLKPYLKEWLDKNLPAIVERAVKKEIARIVDKSHG